MVVSRRYVFAATRRLTVVDVSDQSNQHELGGGADLRRFLAKTGAVPNLPRTDVEATLVLLVDDRDPEHLVQPLTLYDARQHIPDRGPEWRLYYREGTPLTEAIRAEAIGPGDLIVYAVTDTGRLDLLVAPAGGTWERAVLSLFPRPGEGGAGLVAVPDTLLVGGGRPGATVALDAIGLEPEVAENDITWLLDQPEVRAAREANAFPTTEEMAVLGRRRASEPSTDPDDLLVAWLDAETQLFYALERVLAAPRFAACESVDDHITVALSLIQARRSRRGRSLELHLKELFEREGIPFGFQVTTEPGSRVDFLFPGKAAYVDPATDPGTLVHLNAKSTVRERWGQVLKEAQRIPAKHLATIDPGLGLAVREVMAAEGVRLVMPGPIADAYADPSLEALSVAGFLAHVRSVTA